MKRKRSNNITVKTLFRQYTVDDVFSGSLDLFDMSKVFMCESCLSCLTTKDELQEHTKICPYRYWIPGDEVYRCGKKCCAVFEIDGRKPASVPFTRRIARISKLFLDEKTTLDDLHFFAFLALFEVDDYGYHFVGYFSKEWRRSITCDNSLSCLMVLPPYRSKGYGALLIELSYEMGRIEGLSGTPERPLSTAGKKIFKRMWREELLRAISSLNKKGIPVTISSLSEESGMTIEDVVVTLRHLNAVFSVTKHSPLICLPRDIISKAEEDKRINRKSFLWISLF
ncbi:acetyltransferase [Trypanosoma theileri]|uniref:histone acetyltransferase n=1 Tax=Trypanosoma theileri TaxID=67003 RepID=A0A1X0NLZ1_9TRYP|nr:acetyltransferase [Trypanosoma theileri]ORC85493.1 acetyltransferase [Trypanosoma theileri]